MKIRERTQHNRPRKTKKTNHVNTVDKAVEKYIEENAEIQLAKEAMDRVQMTKERRIAHLFKRASYLRIH